VDGNARVRQRVKAVHVIIDAKARSLPVTGETT